MYALVSNDIVHVNRTVVTKMIEVADAMTKLRHVTSLTKIYVANSIISVCPIEYVKTETVDPKDAIRSKDFIAHARDLLTDAFTASTAQVCQRLLSAHKWTYASHGCVHCRTFSMREKCASDVRTRHILNLGRVHWHADTLYHHQGQESGRQHKTSGAVLPEIALD